MWCKACRQDVPGVASFAEGGFCCARCGGNLGTDPAVLSATHTAKVLDHGIDLTSADDEQQAASAAPQPVRTPPVKLDDWELEEQLSTAQRLLQQRGQQRRYRPAVQEAPVYRFDPPQLPLHAQAASGPHFTPARPQPAPRTSSVAPLLALLLTLLGVMATVCGAVLLGWGWIDGRAELWNLGMPIALGGQCVMLCGLLVQLERLWRRGTDTASKLNEVDEQLHDLRQTALMLSTTQAGPARSFYTHLSDGASPHLLLADLKGQLDLLAHRLHQR